MAKLKPQSQDTFEAGLYMVEGVDRWITTDSNGTPIWVDQQWGDDLVLIARYVTYKMVEENGQKVKAEGPPGSLQPNELPLFVAAFGGDPTKLPEKLNTTKALLIAEEEINGADKEVKVRVGDKGWVTYVYGMSLPKGVYAFKFKEIRPKKNGKIYWRENKRYNTESVIAQLEVTGQVSEGKIVPSPFEGTVADAWVTRTALYVLRAIIPSAYEALLGEEEEELERLEEMAREEGGTIIGEVGYRNEEDKAPKLIRSTLRPYLGEESLPTEAEANPVDILKAVIEERTDGAAFSGGELTQEGKVWCKENIAELCEEHGIPKEFDRMSKDEIILLLTAIDAEEAAQLDVDDEPW